MPIEFDLPPPDVGREIGVLTARIDWYVTDDRTIIARRNDRGANQTVIKEARLEESAHADQTLPGLLGQGMGGAAVRRPDGHPVLP